MEVNHSSSRALITALNGYSSENIIASDTVADKHLIVVTTINMLSASIVFVVEKGKKPDGGYTFLKAFTNDEYVKAVEYYASL